MTSLVPSIVEVLKNKIALWISNRGNYWTAESAMIASNVKLLEIKEKNGKVGVVWIWIRSVE